MARLRWLIARLSLRRFGFTPGLVRLGFVVYKVTLGQDFFKFFGSPLSVLFHQTPYFYIIWGMNNRYVGGRSSETSIHHSLITL
jgi:hypothetical protein